MKTCFSEGKLMKQFGTPPPLILGGGGGNYAVSPKVLGMTITFHRKIELSHFQYI